MNRFQSGLGRMTLIGIGFASIVLRATPTLAFDRGTVSTFAVLPDGATGPEGIAVAPNGQIYVATFGFNRHGPVDGEGQVYIYRPNGTLIRQISVHGSTSHLLGIAFHPTAKHLLVIDFGGAQVFKVNRDTGAARPFITLPTDKRAGSSLNAMTFDAQGNIYVPDSFQGIIWKTGPNGGEATAWVTDPLLTTTGVPPFGANGLAFNKAGSSLFVANTGNDQIIQIPVTGGNPAAPSVFVNSINGADGLIIDANDNLWVAANQGDEIVVLDPTGKVIAKLGDFDGVKKGTPQGLFFPASLAFDQDGSTLYVVNLALDLRLFGLAQTVDSQWAAQTKHYTVSKLPAVIPPLP
jgi:sugar lactone lactonase YvrE